MRITLPHFPISGGCACGAVRYRLKAPPLAVYACHCKRCQKYTGAYTLSMPVRRADVELSGEPVEHNEPADSGRMTRIFFCPACHVRVWHAPSNPEQLTLMAGTLDDTSWLVPVAHIWTATKQPGVATGEARCFPGPPPSREALFELFARATTA